jgi:EAL domain-containing protein (putative c-di-GMP-specific phosphodiesterase class I)
MPADTTAFSNSTMRCVDCETIDDLVFDTTKLWFFLPTGESFSKLAGLCGRRNIPADQLNDRTISFVLNRADCEPFVIALYGNMSQQELKNVRVLTTAGDEPTALDMSRVVSGDVFINWIKGKWVIDKVSSGDIESWYQPIYPASDTSTPYGAEALLRMRDQDGTIIPPDYVFQVASDADVLFFVDLIARASAVETAARAGFRGKIFVNFNPSSIYDPAYCLRTTAAAINELGLKPSDIVFEITETEKITDIDHLKGILSFYRRAGFMCALDDIGSGWSGLNLLHTFSPDFVKIDMDLIRQIDTDPFK